MMYAYPYYTNNFSAMTPSTAFRKRLSGRIFGTQVFCHQLSKDQFFSDWDESHFSRVWLPSNLTAEPQ